MRKRVWVGGGLTARAVERGNGGGRQHGEREPTARTSRCEQKRSSRLLS